MCVCVCVCVCVFPFPKHYIYISVGKESQYYLQTKLIALESSVLQGIKEEKVKNRRKKLTREICAVIPMLKSIKALTEYNASITRRLDLEINRIKSAQSRCDFLLLLLCFVLVVVVFA